LTKGQEYYAEEYRGLSRRARFKKAALIASDNKRCWWIYLYVMSFYKYSLNPKK
tara:strand:+ start:230 stop:391 length:162 start_codon:yes stop_codon:yes gene_type:complete